MLFYCRNGIIVNFSNFLPVTGYYSGEKFIIFLRKKFVNIFLLYLVYFSLYTWSIYHYFLLLSSLFCNFVLFFLFFSLHFFLKKKYYFLFFTFEIFITPLDLFTSFFCKFVFCNFSFFIILKISLKSYMSLLIDLNMFIK